MAKKKQESAVTTNAVETDFLSLYQQFKKGTVDPSQRKYITTGHATIDSLLSEGKGIPLGSYIELSSKSGCGKCVTGDTIIDVNGVLQRIDNNIENLGFTEAVATENNLIKSRNDYVNFSHKYKEHVSTIVTVSDTHGNKISCTPIHPLLVITDDGKEEWVTAEKLKLKDKILMAPITEFKTVKRKDTKQTDVFDEELANIKARENHDKEILFSYLEGYDLLKSKSYWKYGFMLDVSSQDLDAFSKELEYYNISKSNNWGEYEYSERNVDQYKFYTHQKEGKKDKIYIRIDLDEASTNKHVNHLILSKKESSEDENDYVKQFYRPMSHQEFFAKIAGILDSAGTVYYNQKYYSYKRISLFANSKEDISFIQRMLSMFGIVGHQSIIDKKYKYCLNLTPTSSYMLAKIVRPFSVVKKQELDWFIDGFDVSEILSEKQNYLKISEICIEAKDCFVYDYTIPTTHEFLANGIVSHNTTLVLDIVKHACEQGYRVMYIDAETGLSENLLKKMGLMEYYNNSFVVISTTTFDRTGALLDVAVKDPNIALIIVDSLTALTPDELVADGKKISDGQIGIKARYTGNLLQRYRERINNNEKTMIFINQMRTHIAMGYGSSYDAPAGANTQQFTMDIRLMMKCAEVVKAEDGHQIGAINEIWAIKNRYGEPFKRYTTKLIFGKGIDEITEYASWLIDNGIVEKGRTGTHTIMWKGQEVKTRSQALYHEWVENNFDEIKAFVEEHGGLIPQSDDMSEDFEEADTTEGVISSGQEYDF